MAINLKKYFPVLLLAALILWAAYHSIIPMRSYLLNNTIEYRLGLSWGKKGRFDEYDSIRELIASSESVTASNPETCLLAGNTALRWVVNGVPETDNELFGALYHAEQYYIQCLNLQPDNPFLWINLANVIQQQVEKKALFEHALKQAKKYGKTQPVIIRTSAALNNAER